MRHHMRSRFSETRCSIINDVAQTWCVAGNSLIAAAWQPLQRSRSRSFAVSAPTIWNSLPLAIRSSVPLTVFGANSNLSSITLLSGLLNAPPYPSPQIRRVSRWHCALYKFTYLLTCSDVTRTCLVVVDDPGADDLAARREDLFKFLLSQWPWQTTHVDVGVTDALAAGTRVRHLQARTSTDWQPVDTAIATEIAYTGVILRAEAKHKWP